MAISPAILVGFEEMKFLWSAKIATWILENSREQKIMAYFSEQREI